MAKEPQAKEARAELSSPKAGTGAALPAGRAVVFEAAVLVHLDAAYTLARYLTRRGDAAEDIVQEALLRAYRGFESQRGGNVRAWLLAIVRNCFLTWNARGGRNPEEPAFEDELEPFRNVPDDRETPESILIERETHSTVQALIEALPQPFREIIVLRDIEGMSYREIAEIAEIPIGTVMSRLARARTMLAAAWKGSEMKVGKEKLS